MLEKSYRLIYEQIENQWQYYEPGDIKDEKDKRKLNQVGVTKEEDVKRAQELEFSKPGMFQAKQMTVDSKQFADMLGIPLSTLIMMMKDHHERDPLVKSSIHEQISFIKVQEGYPMFYGDEHKPQNQVKLTPDAKPIGMLEMFESLSQITKVAAVTYTACKEVADAHRPDNGLIASAMDMVTMQFLHAELKAVRAEIEGLSLTQQRDLDIVQDDSILGNSEKMMFYQKELVASVEDPSLTQNPFVLTKLDIDTIKEFDFDLQQRKGFKKKIKSQMSKLDQRVQEVIQDVEEPVGPSAVK